MMEFKEPKVEIISIKPNQAVYASPGVAGGVEYCNGSQQQPDPNCPSSWSYHFPA